MNAKENIIKNLITKAHSTNQKIMLITPGGVISGTVFVDSLSDVAPEVFVNLKDVVFRNGNLTINMD